MENVNFDRTLYAVERTTPTYYYAPGDIKSTTTNIPLVDVGNSTSSPGGSIAAAYNFTDNGSKAMLDISTAFNLSGWYGVGEQGGGGASHNDPITFTTTKAVNFSVTASFWFTEDIYDNGILSIAAILSNKTWGDTFNINADGNFTKLEHYQVIPGSQSVLVNAYQTITGTLQANTTYSLTEASAAYFSCCPNFGRANITDGHTDIALSLTDPTATIPEPASISLLVSGLLGFRVLRKKIKLNAD